MVEPRLAKRAAGTIATRLKPKKAAPRRRNRALPYRQGDLDGLCGVYAIVNAIRRLRPSLTEPQAAALFAQLMRAVRSLDNARTAIANRGLTHEQLHRLIDAARKHMLKAHQFELIVHEVPAEIRRQWSVTALWKLIGRHVSRQRVVLLGIFGRHDHWTLAVGITRGQITLYDSGGLRVLRRSFCAVRRQRDRPGLNVIKARDVVALGCRRTVPSGFKLEKSTS